MKLFKRPGIWVLLGLAVTGLSFGGHALWTAYERAALRTELRQEAFVHAQWASASAAGAALAQLGARFAEASGDLGDLVRRRQDLVEAWRAADHERAEALRLEAASATAALDAAAARQADLERLIAEVDRQLAAGFPQYQDLARPEPLAETEVQALLEKDEALILVLGTPDDAFVFAVTREAADWIRVDRSEAEMAGEVRTIRAALDPNGPARAAESTFGDELGEVSPPGASFPRTVAHDLYTKILQPLETTWGRKSRLLIVASGALTSLPFGVFVTAPPTGTDNDPDALRQTPWLIRRVALVTLPTVASLKTLRVLARPTRPDEPFRGFGSPALDGPGAALRSGPGTTEALARGGRVDVAAVRRLDPLPATETELRAIAAALRAPAGSITLGTAATETMLKRADLSRTRIIAFATHGLVAGELRGLAEPALVLTPPDTATSDDDGLLTASEAARLTLNADWVLLSACNTASGDGRPGAMGLSGLARAFFYAGARSLLVSHWPVLDDAAAALTIGALERLDRDPGVSRAEALRQSMLALMDRTDVTHFAHPSAWAPFVVVGEGR